jgi:hypothetical protein
VARKPGRRGERAISRKPLRREGRDVSGEPVVTNSCAFYFCTRGCGCIGHPVFPAPSFLKRDNVRAQLGRDPRRENVPVRAAFSAVIVREREERSQGGQSQRVARMRAPDERNSARAEMTGSACSPFFRARCGVVGTAQGAPLSTLRIFIRATL